MLTLVMGAAIHDLSHLAHRCMTSATSHIPLPAYHCSRLCPTSQGWGILFQQRGMVYPFLNKLLRGCVRWDLQCALLEVTSCIWLSQKRKADLIIEIEKTANMSADSHAKICRFLLNLKTKTQIDTLIWSSMPARTKTKAASIDALIRADADAHAPNNGMDAASIDVAAMQLVPWWPPEADACYTPGGQARACARLRKYCPRSGRKQLLGSRCPSKLLLRLMRWLMRATLSAVYQTLLGTWSAEWASLSLMVQRMCFSTEN